MSEKINHYAAEEFLTLPYWARHDILSYEKLKDSVYNFIKPRTSSMDIREHPLHKTIRIPMYYNQDRFLLKSLLDKKHIYEHNTFYDGLIRISSPYLYMPLESRNIANLTKGLLNSMDIDLSLTKENYKMHATLSNGKSLETNFNDEYQSILKLYRFIWEEFYLFHRPSITSLKGNVDILNDGDKFFIEFCNLNSVDYFIKHYSLYAKYGNLIPEDAIKGIQSNMYFNNRRRRDDEPASMPKKIGEVSFIEGNFSLYIMPKN